MGDLDLVELNEAFAAVALWSARLLGIPRDRVNVHGGAVALGHPLGATGARIVVTLINALRRTGGTLGAAALCGGGGQGDALIVRAAAVSIGPDRNLALELARVTEAAALAAARWQGRGNKEAVDQAAVDAMRAMLATLDIDGVVVIGEGEKDEAPMLANGERIGNGHPPLVDVAVDPVDGTRLTAEGGPGALAVLALADRGSMYAPGRLVYMEKIAVGEEAAGSVDLEAPVEENLRRVSLPPARRSTT